MTGMERALEYVRARTGRRWRSVGLLALLAVLACGGAKTPNAVNAAAPAAEPRVFLLRAENLARTKQRLRAGDPRLRPAYDALRRDASAALAVDRFSVVDKKRLAPSGDRHDYMSFGPYWWPDSTKPDGLPYVRRDGQVNPESRADMDSPRFRLMVGTVEALALAHYLSDDRAARDAYAWKAAALLRAWFLDSATRMNPHLRYGQAIPGVIDGRGIGIIDTRDLARVVDAVGLIERSAAWTSADQRGITAWMRAFLDWLRTSEHGRDEQDEENNHGVWYDAQTASLALFVGDVELARRIIGRDAVARVGAQIAADGKMPHELARTRPLHYTLFTIEPFERLAELGRHVGVDLWRYEAPSGGSLRKALLFAARFADPAVPRPGPEAMPVDSGLFPLTLRAGAAALGEPALGAALAKLPPEEVATHRSALLYPDVPNVPSAGAGAPDRSALDTLAERALRHAAAQLRRTAESLDPAQGYPRVSRPDGRWEVRPATAWTSGFFAGSLWYMYDLTRDSYWRTQAERWTAGLEPAKALTGTHDLGFIIFDSFGHGLRLTGNPHYRAVILEASATLARRFSPVVGAIKSWDTEGATDGRGGWAFPVIVDNLMNLEMLFWAGANGGDPGLRSIAERHAMTSLRAHLRDDGSSAHVALFDPGTGALLRRVTWQGYADTSTWARGQAWAIHGLTMAYRESRRPELLAGAQRAADYFLAHLPADQVPYWDFRHPDIPRVERDASAAAIAASGLFELASQSQGASAARYRLAAERILSSLCTSYLTTDGSSAAVLKHATGQRPQGMEIDVGLVYADYYLVEALVRYRTMR